METNNSPNKNQKDEPYDLSEESSKRLGGEEATTEARIAENDDVTGTNISKPDDDSAENRITTSLSDD